ncbi:MAG: secretin N-terminal domain-containing protein [Thermoguttaceae bacterium]
MMMQLILQIIDSLFSHKTELFYEEPFCEEVRCSDMKCSDMKCCDSSATIRQFIFGIVFALIFVSLFVRCSDFCVAAEKEKIATSITPSGPSIYQIRTSQIGFIEEQLRNRYQNEADFSMNINSEAESNTFRIGILASDKVQKEVLEWLQQHAQMQSLTRSESVLQVGIVPDSKQNINHVQQTSLIVSETIRDSFAPSIISIHAIQLQLSALLHPYFREIEHGKFLFQSPNEKIQRQCTIEVDRENGRFVLTGDKILCSQFVQLLDEMDQPPLPPGRQRSFLPIHHVKHESVTHLLEICKAPRRWNVSTGNDSTSATPKLPTITSSPKSPLSSNDLLNNNELPNPAHLTSRAHPAYSALAANSALSPRSPLAANSPLAINPALSPHSPLAANSALSSYSPLPENQTHQTQTGSMRPTTPFLTTTKVTTSDSGVVFGPSDQPPPGVETGFRTTPKSSQQSLANSASSETPNSLFAEASAAFRSPTLPTKTTNAKQDSPNRRLEFKESETKKPTPLSVPAKTLDQTETRRIPAHRNPLIQLVGYQFQDGGDMGGGGSVAPIGVANGGSNGGANGNSGGISDGNTSSNTSGMEVVSDFRYQILPDLDVLVIDATGAEVARFTDMIRQIEELSKNAEPKIEVAFLKHVNCVSLNWVLMQVYIDLFRTKQGTVRVIPLINPNAMLLVGWGHALDAMKDLIETLDKPVAVSNSLLKVIRLKYASAQYVLTVLRGTFPIPPMQNSGFAPRIQMFADSRTNSLVIQAGPNDLQEIERLVSEIDVSETGPKLQVRTFKLKHTLVDDLAQVLTNAIQPGTAGTADRKLPELFVISEDGHRMINSGIMSDVSISKDVRNNTVIITAPERCMPLIEELILMIDSPAATAEIKVFQILYGDANSLIKTLQSLIPSQIDGQVGPQLPGAKDDDTLVPIRFAVDTRTNSILAAGTPNDLKIVEALLYSIDREDQQARKQTVYQLKSMKAGDVALAINDYIRSKRLIQQDAPGVVSPYQQIESEVIVIPEAVSNTLIVSATPRYHEEIMKLIQDIDRLPPQVVIQVLIGEVALSNTDEFGAEFGIQDSLLFNRSTFNNITTGTRKITKTENGVTTVIEEPVITNGNAVPGWLFNENPSNSLNNGYNTNSANTVGTVGSQILTNFATGRVGAESGFGGLVFSANSDAVSIMLRALQETSRLEILSRPVITAMNNQQAFIHVGQLVPRFKGTTTNNFSRDANVVDEKVGLLLMVTPSISPEGNVVMLVAAEKSKLGSNVDGVVVGISEGKEIRSPKIDKIFTVTTISAADNETVVLGGLISKENHEIKRKVPLLGDIPLLGKLFRYEYTKSRRSELIIILTPRIVRDQSDMDEIKRVEAARMHWCLGNVAQLHGDIGVYNSIAENPYFGDAKVVYPDAINMDDLTPLDEFSRNFDGNPTLAPPQMALPNNDATNNTTNNAPKNPPKNNATIIDATQNGPAKIPVPQKIPAPTLNK